MDFKDIRQCPTCKALVPVDSMIHHREWHAALSGIADLVLSPIESDSKMKRISSEETGS